MRTGALLVIALIGAISACGSKAAPQQQQQQPAVAPARSIHPCGRSGTAPARYAHVVWIVMENKSYTDVMKSSSAPFVRSLAAACGLATNFHAESHPSLPNYIAMTSGSTQGVQDDGPPSSHPINGQSIFSQLGSRWRALQESMPKRCDRSDSPLYAPRHNPATYYTNLAKSCGKQDVRLGRTPDLSARFTFITPNLCHDMHNCGVSTGDRYLSTLIPKIVNSKTYRAGRTAVFLTWDEDDGSSSNHVPTIVIAPKTPAGTRSAAGFTHYSMLRTTEQLLGLKPIGAAAAAPSMRAPFGL